MIRRLFIAQMLDAGDHRRIAVRFRPGHAFSLRFGGMQFVVRVVLDHITGDGNMVAAFRARLDIGVRHCFISQL